MRRLSPLVFVIVFGSPLFAQSMLDRQATLDVINVANYCAHVDDYSSSRPPRVFARITSGYGVSIGWAEFENGAAWRRAGEPKPVAFVWQHNSQIVRAAIFPNDEDDQRIYADYCYRPDGNLARLRPMPSQRHKCEPRRLQCTYTLREVRFYPPEGGVLKTYGSEGDELLSLVKGNADGVLEGPPAERTIVAKLPTNLPEYLSVTDLPFDNLFYRTLR